MKLFTPRKHVPRKPSAWRSTKQREHSLRFEPLETRDLLTLLGIAPGDQRPLIDYYTFTAGAVNYTCPAPDDAEARGTFAIDSIPWSMLMEDGTFLDIWDGADAPAAFTIRILVGSDGSEAASCDGSGADLKLTGAIDFDGDGTDDVSGTLLTGTISAFGFQDYSGTADQYDFRFHLTGGLLSSCFQDKDIGVITDSENSTFAGSFETSFAGKAKGYIFPIEPLPSGVPGIDIEKFTNGADADDPSGPDVPEIAPGDTVTWTYEVTNIGEVPFAFADVVVTDDCGTPEDASDDFNPTFDSGSDAGSDGVLSPGEVWIYTASGTAQDLSTSGSSVYENKAVVTADGVGDEDLSHYKNPPVNPPLTAAIDIEKYVKKACGGEGLTPGFWKQCQHFDDWTTYHPSDSYNQVFGINDCAGLTLLESLSRGGGGNKALGRHAVAALLNAAHPNVDYAFSESEIVAMVRQAYATGDFESVKNQLAAENERGANLDDGCPPCPPGYGEDADEPTGPLVDVGQRVQFTYVVTNPGEVPLADVTVVDDHGTPQTDDDFSPSPVLSGGLNVGDADQDGLLDVGETWLYSHTTAITCCTPAGQHVNDATVMGNPVGGQGQVTDHDVAYWYVGQPSTAALGDFVWEDANRNGKQDCGEKGLSGVTVELLDSHDRVLATTITDNAGKYAFTELPSGSYKVKVLAPKGYEFSPQYRGSRADVDSNVDPHSGVTDWIRLDSGEVDRTIDAGLYRKCSVAVFGGHDCHWIWNLFDRFCETSHKKKKCGHSC